MKSIWRGGGAYSWKGLNNDSTVQVKHIIVALNIGQNQKPKKNEKDIIFYIL